MALSRITNPFLSSSGAGNASITSPSANTIAFSTTTTERMRIDSSGNVGIGTSSPAFKLEVVGATNNGIHLKDAASATVYGGLFTQAASLALYARSNHALNFGTNDTERMRILTTGNILSLSGGSTTATGTGIAFPATQSASSDANTLDDYEEGTWTPILTSSGGAVTATYNRQQGKYVKIGNMVYISGSINTGTTAATPAGVARIGGLPFTSGNNNGEADRTTFTMGYIQFTASSTAQPRGLLLNANSTLADFYRADGADARSGFTTTVSQLDINTSGVNIYFSGTYFTPT